MKFPKFVKLTTFAEKVKNSEKILICYKHLHIPTDEFLTETFTKWWTFSNNFCSQYCQYTTLYIARIV